MGLCVAGVAMALMALKMFTWLTVARVHASAGANAVYVASTVLMLWTYALSMTVDAGPPQLAADHRVRAAEDGDAADKEDDGHSSGYCERCDAPKPPRVHHCSACRRCVYRMDHHCPWTNNCVGNGNKKFFLLFLAYTSLSCLSFHCIVAALLLSEDPTIIAARSSHAALLQLGWLLSLAIGGVLALYLAFHVWLLHTGRTTLEFISNTPGELATYPFWFNVRVYFGRDPWTWWLPVAPRRRYEAPPLVS